MEENKKQINKLIELFNELDTNDKRNELSALINKINIMINELLKLESGQNLFKVKRYNIEKNKNMEESEILSFIYEDIYSLKNNLLVLLTMMINKQQ